MEHRDEVSEIISRWQTAKPELNMAPLAVFSRLARLTKHLNKLRAAAFEAADLEIWEFDVLAVLRRAGAETKVSVKTLVQETMVTSGTMTNRLDRLCGRGLVARTQDPNDGRGVLVQITAAGIARVDQAFTALLSAETQALKGLTAAEQQRLANLLSKLGTTIKLQ
ncbi:MarR family transcriptional regulator [Leucobacter sp. OH2974_COT-288]|uniref:DNA-binding MarR family transcriptional regulator n=1 Tax=Canibacter oris TaxID=1365628 RepID=A0A840DE20_9MICO|nr:MarR family transcriptional regulator [Canibacter oris]MBB4070890.1 DNA-binding MarR family transcriptional regulator [Canibacter oris]RRD36585.1 MarR family transcriptional regulator [Leucobacter sp. OH2974_COT-288]